MRAIIVDDEMRSRKLLRTAIDNFTSGIEIVGEANSVASAVIEIKALSPEILFLDIQLGDGLGFDILEQLHPQEFKVVFVTAYDQYAIRAIKFGALDYILKPIDLEDLKSVAHRLHTTPKLHSEKVAIARDHMKDTGSNKIMISTSKGFISLNLDHILALVAYGNYVFIHTEDNKYIANNTIQYYEDLLDKNDFYRIHRSHIVNVNNVISVDNDRAGSVTMSNGMKLDLAARRKTAFLQLFKKSLDS